jgi:hypothetical protein
MLCYKCKPQASDSSQISSSSTSSPNTYIPSYYHNAKYEDTACKAIIWLYDGSEDNLIPFLTLLNIRCKDEGWKSATYCTTMIDEHPQWIYFTHWEIYQCLGT